jgi:hypothetical protein
LKQTQKDKSKQIMGFGYTVGVLKQIVSPSAKTEDTEGGSQNKYMVTEPMYTIESIQDGNISYGTSHLLSDPDTDIDFIDALASVFSRSICYDPELTPSRRDLREVIEKYYENVDEIPQEHKEEYWPLFLMLDVAQDEEDDDVRLWLCG